METNSDSSYRSAGDSVAVSGFGVPARLLTSTEIHAELPIPIEHGEYIGSQTVAFTWFAWSSYIDAIQRKFCEVNGIALATGAPHAE